MEKIIQVENPAPKCSPLEVEYSRLLTKYRALEERLYKVKSSRSIHIIVWTLLGTCMVYLAWACGWVNFKFLIAVSAVCIAVVAATLGGLWERAQYEGGVIR